MEKLTNAEEEVMRVIWQSDGGYIKEFLERMPEPRPPYTTLASVVKNLERKEYLTTRRVGNTIFYTPAVAEADYKRKFLSGFVRNYFANSYKDMISFFAKEEELSPEDLKEIIDMIEKKKK